MDINFAPAEAGTATLQDLIDALGAVQWDFAETEDAAAIATYTNARKIQGDLTLQYSSNNPHENDIPMLMKIDETWRKYAPANYQQ